MKKKSRVRSIGPACEGDYRDAVGRYPYVYVNGICLRRHRRGRGGMGSQDGAVPAVYKGTVFQEITVKEPPPGIA